VTFSLERGHTLGVVGPSGAGKSTLARCLAFFETPTSGEIWLDGLQRVAMRADIQLIFQEPASSLNPRFTAAQIVTEPLVIHGIGTAKTRLLRASELMETVGLPPQALPTPALEFSGGERAAAGHRPGAGPRTQAAHSGRVLFRSGPFRSGPGDQPPARSPGAARA